MLLTIPVSRADDRLAVGLAKHLAALGGLASHAVWICPCESADPDLVKEVVAALPQARVVPLDTRDERGWPLSANSVFAEIAFKVFEAKADGHACWLFMEADCVPMHARWADDLEAEWRNCGKPLLGVKNKTVFDQPDGTVREDGEHMVGAGVYSTDFYHRIRLAKNIYLSDRPFDVFIQWEAVPQMAESELIQHNWGTRNYKKSRTGEITCDSASPIPRHAAYAKPLRKGLALVHGVKDGSLIALLKK